MSQSIVSASRIGFIRRYIKSAWRRKIQCFAAHIWARPFSVGIYYYSIWIIPSQYLTQGCLKYSYKLCPYIRLENKPCKGVFSPIVSPISIKVQYVVNYGTPLLMNFWTPNSKSAFLDVDSHVRKFSVWVSKTPLLKRQPLQIGYGDTIGF